MALRLAIFITALDRGLNNIAKADTLVGKLTATVKSFGVAAASLAAIEFAEFAADSVRTFATFDRTIRQAAAVMATSTSEMSGNFEALEARSRELAQTTVFTATEIGQAFFFLGQAGLSLEESLVAVDAVLDLAQIGMIELGEASDIVTDIMAGMGISVERLDETVDILTATFTNANTNISQLGTAFSKIGPLAANLGIDITEVSAAIGVLSSAGIKGEEAGTAIRNIFLRLLNPSREATRVLATVGITAEQVAAGVFSLEDILRILKDGLDSGALAADDIAKIFQARATPAVLALANSLDDTEQGFAAFTDTLEQSGGKAEEVVGFINDSAAFAFDRWRAFVEDLKIEMGEALIPTVINLIETLRDNREEILAVFLAIGSMLGRLGVLVPLIVTVATAFNDLFQIMDDAGVFSGLERVVAGLVGVLESLGPLLPFIVLGLIAWLSPLTTIIILVGILGPLLEVLLNAIAFLIRGIINTVLWAGKLISIFLEVNGAAGAWREGVRDLGIEIGKMVAWLKKAWEWVVKLGEGLADNKVGDFLKAVGGGIKTVFTTTPGFQRGVRGKARGGEFIGPMHGGEDFEIANPRLGQTLGGGTGGGPMIGTVVNNFTVLQPDPIQMEQATRKHLRRLSRR
jgi:TP901 family phage tail tape measure protein